MYMRLVQVKTKPGELSNQRKHYDERVVPALQQTPGCLYAGLLKSAHHEDEVISMTLWSSQADAEAYEKSGLFQKLLDEAKPMFAESSEWRVQLSKDLNLEYAPVPSEASVKSYSDASATAPTSVSSLKSSQLYLRIVSLVIKAGMLEEFKKVYTEQVIPALKATKGCRDAFYMQPGGSSTEAISVTIWDTKNAADEYESSGQFGHLLDKVKHTFTDLFQWKMNLERSKGSEQAVTSEDMKVEGFSLMAGRNFNSKKDGN